jgi:mannose-6-phosphate isomerase-like protein (cupin superfamily)
MKRVLFVLSVLSVGYVAGHVTPGGDVFAQAPSAATGGGQAAGTGPRAATNLFLLTTTPETRMVPGKAVMWTREQQASARSHIQWAPEYRLTATTRQPGVAGQEPTTGELHSDNTQIYLVTGGSGTVVVESTVDAKNDYLVAPGEHRGGPLVGGRKLKVTVGDMVSISPNTWHTAYGDAGVALQYLIIQVHTRTTAP